jgi:hypothetical protein
MKNKTEILGYLQRFFLPPDARIHSYWYGEYAKLMNGATEWVHPLDERITLVNGLGGAGMTLALGLAEEVIEGSYLPPQS